jgi:hypothetical protein
MADPFVEEKRIGTLSYCVGVMWRSAMVLEISTVPDVK